MSHLVSIQIFIFLIVTFSTLKTDAQNKLSSVQTLEVIRRFDSKFSNPNELKNDSIARYYSYVQSAENFIVEFKYFKALEQYCKAFQYKTPFRNDYFNAWKIVQEHRIYDSLTLVQLIDGSYKLRNYQNFHTEKLNYIISKDSTFNKSFVRHIRDNFNNDHINFTKVIDSSLIKTMSILFQRDQKARTSGGNIRVADSLNWIELKKMINNQPILSESVLGNSMRDYELLCHHLVRYAHEDLLDELYKQTMKGTFENRRFINLVDYFMDYNYSPELKNQYYLSNISLVLNTIYVIPKIDKELIDAANKRRRMIYVEEIEVQEKKQLYYFRNFDLFFFMYLFNTYADEGDELTLSKKDEIYLNDFMSLHPDVFIAKKVDKDYNISIVKK